MKYDYEDVNVKIAIRLSKQSTLGKILANADVSIRTYSFGYYTTKNFQIWKSQYEHMRLGDYINITPPTPKENGYREITYVENKNDWIELERLIYSAYQNAKSRQGLQEKKMNENVNPEEIPF